MLRVDYGRTRVLLTGDLNRASQHSLLEDYAGQRTEFLSDVAKACHHGSDDISYQFLQAMQPAATVISSGDNEGHDHPRPSIIAASATTGHLQLVDDELLTPLVYSTELARSIDLGRPEKLVASDSSGTEITISNEDLDNAILHITGAKRTEVALSSARVVGGLIYGLVNVRTDGDKILCAVLDEGENDWRIKTSHQDSEHSFNLIFTTSASSRTSRHRQAASLTNITPSVSRRISSRSLPVHAPYGLPGPSDTLKCQPPKPVRVRSLSVPPLATRTPGSS
jgi:hypothetical protein